MCMDLKCRRYTYINITCVCVFRFLMFQMVTEHLSLSRGIAALHKVTRLPPSCLPHTHPAPSQTPVRSCFLHELSHYFELFGSWFSVSVFRYGCVWIRRSSCFASMYVWATILLPSTQQNIRVPERTSRGMWEGACVRGGNVSYTHLYRM